MHVSRLGYPTLTDGVQTLLGEGRKSPETALICSLANQLFAYHYVSGMETLFRTQLLENLWAV